MGVQSANDTASGVWANSTYRIKAIGVKLAERDLKRHIHRRSSRNKPRTARKEPANKTQSKIRAQVGHTSGLIARRGFAAVRSGDQRALLARAMAAHNSHASSIPRRDVIGLIDFASPSHAPRFQLVDIGNGRVLKTLHVAHGRSSRVAIMAGLSRCLRNQFCVNWAISSRV